MADDLVTIYTLARVPSALAQKWLQHLRDFDTANPGCHFEVIGDAPTLSFHEMIEVLRVNPGFSFEQVMMRERKD